MVRRSRLLRAVPVAAGGGTSSARGAHRGRARDVAARAAAGAAGVDGAGDPRAADVYQTLGVYLGYAVAHLASVYDFQYVLVLGRGTTGSGGTVMLDIAREVLRVDFPELAARISLRMPSEKEKRHGQAIAAASLPAATHGIGS